MKKFKNERLKKIRYQLCLSQVKFSKLIGISHGSVNYYETGRRNPSIFTLKKIVKNLNKNGIDITYEELLQDLIDKEEQ